ncbi:MAG: hypothetical protein WDN44_07805 [Sphingomonas sp.]
MEHSILMEVARKRAEFTINDTRPFSAAVYECESALSHAHALLVVLGSAFLADGARPEQSDPARAIDDLNGTLVASALEGVAMLVAGASFALSTAIMDQAVREKVS